MRELRYVEKRIMNLQQQQHQQPIRTVQRMSTQQIAQAAEGKPLEDEERPVYDIDRLKEEAHLLNNCLKKREHEGFGRSLPYPGWMQEHISSLYEENEKLVTMILHDSTAIDMADKMFALLNARQEGKISGNQQDIEFGRLVAKKHFPVNTHSDIDARANENISKTTNTQGGIHVGNLS